MEEEPQLIRIRDTITGGKSNKNNKRNVRRRSNVSKKHVDKVSNEENEYKYARRFSEIPETSDTNFENKFMRRVSEIPEVSKRVSGKRAE